MKLKRLLTSSPGCTVVSSKCTERRSMRTGVPVFMRSERMPSRVMLSVRWSDAGSAHLPPCTIFLPMCISPLRKVPAVMTTAGAYISHPQMVRMPLTLRSGVPSSSVHPAGLVPGSSVSSSSAWSCQMSRFGVPSSTSRHFQMNLPRSHCALGLHMAGPLLLLSIRNCIAVASVTMPMPPPRASISRTICPFAMPPTAGLHDICAILFMSIVTRHVFAPIRAAACAASHPAWPPPTTMTS